MRRWWDYFLTDTFYSIFEVESLELLAHVQDRPEVLLDLSAAILTLQLLCRQTLVSFKSKQTSFIS